MGPSGFQSWVDSIPQTTGLKRNDLYNDTSRNEVRIRVLAPAAYSHRLSGGWDVRPHCVLVMRGRVTPRGELGMDARMGG